MKTVQLSKTPLHYVAPECEMLGIIGTGIICSSVGLGIGDWEDDPDQFNV